MHDPNQKEESGALPQVVVEQSPHLENATADTTVTNSAPAEGVKPVRTNALLEREIFVALNKPWDPIGQFVHLPSGRLMTVAEVSARSPNIDIADTENGRLWVESLRQGMRLIPMHDYMSTTIDREDAEWRQFVDHDGDKISALEPSFRHNNGKAVSGERAVLRVKSLLGMGSLIQVPLWHSGFWITIKAPSDVVLLDLMRRMMEEKVNLGRRTYGLTYSNVSSYTTQWIMDIIMSHIYDTSIKDDDVNLREMILTTDYTTIVWALACAIWRNGFAFARACTADPDKCNHVTQEKINVTKIHWVDTSSLTEWQRGHMSNRGGSSMSVEAIMRYREDFVRGRQRVLELNDRIKMTLKVPNINEYIASGQRWIGELVQMVDGAFLEDQDEDTRNSYINQRGSATTMRQYAHWVESIEADGEVYTEKSTIEQTIDALCADAGIRKLYFESAKKFIEDSTIAVVAIPHAHCPVCGEELGKEDKKFVRLIAIDPVATFFTLLVPKCTEIQNRAG